ncbi:MULTISPECIES: DNA ligase D [Ramlibacter]|uniref:DNA ligase (ATP) n=1 Tax=Ramlibacter aquaticus TaxID=2780094 RepID=A0ABR9SIV5_9BURK|nr:MULTISPECIES: DNA ligase D [Ramlibacter]MBE7941839.1 DNA ligase D [Ramlibacter aquaticus]
MADRTATALKTYRDKRNFDATPEPADGGQADEAARSFVVQKHWASRLHYDFRLELDGTMKSWAVPKGPSFDPAERRMAMPTEDHPIAYNRFEGTIPAGNYGAGEVIIWDKGTWVPLGDPQEGLREGRLKFELQGHKLHGHWTLVRMKGRGKGREDPWLLIKERDGFARPAAEFSVVDELPDSVQALADRPAARTASALPAVASPAPAASRAASKAVAAKTRTPRARKALEAAPAPVPDGPPAGARPAALPQALQPELATLVDTPPADASDWLFEIKFDGYRMLARAEGGQVRLVTRNGNDWTARLGPLAASLEAMALPDGWYDGEIVMPAADGRADFQALQNAFDSARTAGIVYYLFDLPFCAGQDLRAVPLVERRAVLERIVRRKPQPQVRFSETFAAPPGEMLATACRLGLEGVVGKRRGSAYAGRRSPDWIKLKCGQRQEFVIAGFTDPKGSRTGVGALLLGVREGEALRYAGNVGTGFDEATLRRLRAALDARSARASPFAASAGLPRGVHWVRPELVCEVSFGEWTREGRIRHAVFHGLREDKPAAAVARERPGAAGPAAASPAPAAPAPASPAALEPRLPPSLRITHPERVVDAASGVTKIELVRYYALVAPLMMPHLAARPVALVRAPEGVAGELFFQKHLDRYRMEGVAELPQELFPGHPSMLEIREARGLLSAAQMNVLEFHTWNGTTEAMDRPDRLTFDLDPGEGVAWAQMQEAARLVQAFLQELGLPAFLKTSGGKGLHVIVPLQREFGWDAVKDFSRSVVQHLSTTLPQRFVAKSGGRNRVGRIFIDYLRNGLGATTACAWSARARPGLGISVPVRWDELAGLRGGDHWTVRSVHARLAVGNSPWESYEGARVALRPAMDRLGFRP